MNIYHITYSPDAGIVHLHFWGCNLKCRACLLKKELYDCHLEEVRKNIFDRSEKSHQVPARFLDLEEVIQILGKLDISQVVFMGAEPAIDPQLPALAELLHWRFASHNVLLTNGLKLAELEHVDEVVFSIKAVTDRLHRHYTQKSNKKALTNFMTLSQSGIRLRAESIFIPEYIDFLEIDNIAKFIGKINSTIPYRIDAYIPTGDNPWRRPTPEEMEEAASIARKYLLNVSFLTGNENPKHEVLRIF